MKRFAIIVATMIGVVCFSACDWEPFNLWDHYDSSKVTMTITCPKLGLDNVIFQNENKKMLVTSPNIQGNQLAFQDDLSFKFQLYKECKSPDGNCTITVVIFLCRVLPPLEYGYKYKISEVTESNTLAYLHIEYTSSDEVTTYSICDCIDGYIEFTSCSVPPYNSYLVSGNFELIFEDAIISNGTFTNLECF